MIPHGEQSRGKLDGSLDSEGNSEQKIQRVPKSPLPLLKSREQKQGIAHVLCIQYYLKGRQTIR